MNWWVGFLFGFQTLYALGREHVGGMFKWITLLLSQQTEIVAAEVHDIPSVHGPRVDAVWHCLWLWFAPWITSALPAISAAAARVAPVQALSMVPVPAWNVEDTAEAHLACDAFMQCARRCQILDGPSSCLDRVMVLYCTKLLPLADSNALLLLHSSLETRDTGLDWSNWCGSGAALQLLHDVCSALLPAPDPVIMAMADGAPGMVSASVAAGVRPLPTLPQQSLPWTSASFFSCPQYSPIVVTSMFESIQAIAAAPKTRAQRKCVTSFLAQCVCQAQWQDIIAPTALQSDCARGSTMDVTAKMVPVVSATTSAAARPTDVNALVTLLVTLLGCSEWPLPTWMLKTSVTAASAPVSTILEQCAERTWPEVSADQYGTLLNSATGIFYSPIFSCTDQAPDVHGSAVWVEEKRALSLTLILNIAICLPLGLHDGTSRLMALGAPDIDPVMHHQLVRSTLEKLSLFFLWITSTFSAKGPARLVSAARYAQLLKHAARAMNLCLQRYDELLVQRASIVEADSPGSDGRLQPRQIVQQTLEDLLGLLNVADRMPSASSSSSSSAAAAPVRILPVEVEEEIVRMAALSHLALLSLRLTCRHIGNVKRSARMCELALKTACENRCGTCVPCCVMETVCA